MHLTLLPAEACNFACPYCFQYKKRNVLMSDWVYDAVYKLVESSIEQGLRHLKVGWFGGEPTLTASRIISFMNRLLTLQSRGLLIRGSMVTNGYLLTAELLTEFVAAGIRQFQVTLDGDRENHDRLRYLKDGSPTFDKIYSNLQAMAKLDFEFEISIRCNFLRSSIESMEKMLYMFLRDFGYYRRFSIYFRPVYYYETAQDSVDQFRAEICTIQEGLALQNRLAIQTMQLVKRQSYMRIFDPLPKPTPSWCPSDRVNSYIVGADGTLFVCDTLVGDKSKAIGHLSRDGLIIQNEKAQAWRSTIFDEKNNEKCMSCKLLPLCLGGCHRIRIMTGEPLCFWRHDDIVWAMHQYVKLYASQEPQLAKRESR